MYTLYRILLSTPRCQTIAGLPPAVRGWCPYLYTWVNQGDEVHDQQGFLHDEETKQWQPTSTATELS